MNLNTLGRNIRRARQNRGLTQDNAAQKLGCSLNTYTKIERGETNVPFMRLVQIAECYGISLTDLVREGGETDARDMAADIAQIRSDIKAIKNFLMM